MKNFFLFALLLAGMASAQQISFEEHSGHGITAVLGSFISADVNGDGIDDVFAAGLVAHGSPAEATLYFGNGDGTFSPAPVQPFIPLEGERKSAIFVYVDEVPKYLIAFGPFNEVMRTIVYINDGAGNFSLHQELTGMRSGSIATGALHTGESNTPYVLILGNLSNGGGLALHGYKLQDGYFVPVSLPSVMTDNAPGWAPDIHIFDYNLDGAPDVLMSGVCTGGCYATKLYRNDGDMNFSLVATPFVEVGWSNLASGTLEEGNPYPWVAVSGEDSSGNRTSRLYRNDAGVFSLAQTLPLPTNGDIVIDDVDNDGHLDMFLLGTYSDLSCIARMFKNTGTGQMTLARTFEPGLAGTALLIDINSDGKKDLIYTGGVVPLNIWIRAFINTTQTVGLDDFDSKSFVMYPNPTRDVVYITTAPGLDITGIYVTDMAGRRFALPVSDRVDLGNFSSGMYYITLVTDQGQTSKPVVKR